MRKGKNRYIVEVNDWGCGLMIKDTQTGREIDAPDDEVITLCIKEMNSLAKELDTVRSVAEDNKREYEATRIENDRLKAEVERLTKAGWQPMETAPFNRNIRIIVDRNDEGEVGIIWSSDVQHYSVEQYPDWWMPLPVAPAEEGDDQP